MFDFFKKTIRYAQRSPEWRTVRTLHLSREPECCACGRSNNLEVHHIIPVHLNKTQELEPSNLITLCDKCHLIFGHLYDYRSWNPNVVQDSKNFYNKIKNRPYKENTAVDFLEE